MVRRSIFILCAMAFSLRVMAGEASLAQAVRELGAPSFAVRQAARAALAEAGWEARRELEEASRHPDPEVSDVARQLLAGMLPGVTRDTPDSQRQLVVRYVAAQQSQEKRALLQELLKERPIPCVLLLDLMEWEKSPAAQSLIAQCMLGDTPAILGPLLEQGDCALYERLLQWTVRLEMVEAIPRVVLYARRDGSLAALRNQVAALLSRDDRPYLRRLLTELCMMEGDSEAALATAAVLDDSVYRRELLVRTERWAELATELAEELGQPSGPRLVQLAAVQRLADENQLAAETLSSLAGAKEDGADAEDEDGPDMSLFWLGNQVEGMGGRFLQFQGGMDMFAAAPMVHPSRRGRQQVVEGWAYILAYGLAADALAELQRQNKVDVATALLVQQYRYVEADRLLREALAKAQAPQDIWLRIRRAGILHELGDPQASKPVRELLEACRRGEAEVASDEVFRMLPGALEQAGFQSLYAEALPDLLGRFTDPRDGNLRNAAQYLASPRKRGLVWFWWEQLARSNPGEAMADRAVRVRDFLAGKLEPEEEEKILRLALRPDASMEERVSSLQQVGMTCLCLGRQDDSLAAYRMAVRCATESEGQRQDRLVRAARHGLANALQDDVGRSSVAAEEFGLLWQDNRQLVYLQFHGLALAWSGERDAAEKAVGQVLALADPGSVAWLLRYLDPEDWPEESRELLVLVDRGGGTAPSQALPAARRLGDYELERRLARRQWYDAVVSPANKTPGNLLQINSDLAFAECRARLATGGAAATLATAKQISDAFPFDVDGAADTVEALDRAGFAKEADELTAHVLEREQGILDKLPDASQHLNGYAWMCARTGRNLEQGETCVRRALGQMPENDAYLDTLAVVLHRRGDLDGAVAAMRTCLRLKPHDHHYRWQLAKWLSEAGVKP